MKALKLSKLVRAAVPMVARRPPFGASGLTHSKLLKSAGYLSSPKADRPCLGPSAAEAAVARARAASSTAGLRIGISLAFTDARIFISRPGRLAPRLSQPLGRRVVIPPHLEEGLGLRRQFGRPTERVPDRNAIRGRTPLRHDVAIPQEYSVERPGGGRQIGAVFGKHNLVDQHVDRGI